MNFLKLPLTLLLMISLLATSSAGQQKRRLPEKTPAKPPRHRFGPMDTPNDAGGQAGSLRLDFAYDHNGLRLRKRTGRRKQAPPGGALDHEPVLVEYSAAELDLGLWRRHDRLACLLR